MANEEHVAKLKEGVEVWNKWREENPRTTPSLNNTDLSRADLSRADLNGADLSGAVLSGAVLSRADLSRADLSRADLSRANLSNADLGHADLRDADLREADLGDAYLGFAYLGFAYLGFANFSNANFSGTQLSAAIFGSTNLGCNGLADAKNLREIRHHGSSFLPTSTLADSQGRLPEEFLRECGLSEWEILSAKLHDPRLSTSQIAEIQQQIFDERAKGFFLCGAFISYSHKNSAFANQVYERLKDRKVNVWLDKHDLISGPLAKQIDSAIRINDVVLIILSKESVQSGWVHWELKRAHKLKTEQGRDILCPIALDDSWKDAADADPNWDVLTRYNILDFSDWEIRESFDREFEKLIKGITRYYANE